MSVGRDENGSKSILLHPRYQCNHCYAVKVSKDTSAAMRRQLKADCLTVDCPSCLQKARAAATRANTRRERTR